MIQPGDLIRIRYGKSRGTRVAHVVRLDRKEDGYRVRQWNAQGKKWTRSAKLVLAEEVLEDRVPRKQLPSGFVPLEA